MFLTILGKETDITPVLKRQEAIRILVGTALAHGRDEIMFTIGGDFFLRGEGFLQRVEIKDAEELFDTKLEFQEEALAEIVEIWRRKEAEGGTFSSGNYLDLTFELEEETTTHMVRTFVLSYMNTRAIFVSLRIFREMPFSLQGLGFDARIVDYLKRIRWGLILVTSPSRGGKSTTARSLLLELGAGRLVVTYEAPIERELQNTKGLVVQKGYGTDFHTWSDLKAERQGPFSVVLIDSVQSREAWEAALEIASAGKIVIAVAEGVSVLSTLANLETFILPEEKEIRRLQLSRVLQAAIYQNLVPRKDSLMKPYALAWEVLLTSDTVRNYLSQGKYFQIGGLGEGSKVFIPYTYTLKNLYDQDLIARRVYEEEKAHYTGFLRKVKSTTPP